MDCTIYVAKTKVLISCAVTAQLICVFVFACAKIWFSHDVAHISLHCLDRPFCLRTGDDGQFSIVVITVKGQMPNDQEVAKTLPKTLFLF